VRHLLDAVQDVRVRYRQELLTDKRLQCKAFKQEELRYWYSEVEKAGVMEMENFASLVQRHEGFIVNYFVNGDTNAIAEAMNSKIQRLITLNKGTRNKEFSSLKSK
jgi:transposase